jgi:lambda family phage tail tape measure protein
MADLTYKATVDVSQAERSLSNLQKSVGGLNDTFVRLKSTLATISLGAIITQTMGMADAISDLSDATEISIENIIGFSRAVALNGGTVEGAQKGIARLVTSIDDAAEKFGSSRKAFNDVGVSLDDLRRLGTEDIFKKTVEGLGKIDDVSKRNRLSVELLGKEFRAVNSAGVAAAFGPAAADSIKFAAATKSAADASDKLASAIDTFRQQLLVAIKPVNDLINSLDPKKIAAFTQTVIDIAQGLVLLYAATKAASGIRFLIDSFRVLGGTGKATTGLLGEAALGLKQLGQAFDLNTARTVASYTGFSVLGITLKSLAGGFVRLIPLVGALYAGFQILDGVVEMLTGRDLSKWFDDAASGLENFVSKNLPGVAEQLNKLGEALGMAPPPSVQRENAQELARIKARADAAKKAQEDLKRGQEAVQRIANEAAKQKLSNEQYVQDLAIGLSRQTEAIALETRMIELSRLKNVLSEDQVEIIKAQSEASVARLAAIKRLEDQQAKLRLDMAQTQDEDQKKIIANQIAGLGFQIEKTKEYYSVHFDSLEYYITNLQTAKKLDAARLQDMENMKKAIEDQIVRQQTLGDTLQKINDQKIDIQFQGTQIGRGPLEKQFADIKENARKSAVEAGRTFAAAFEDTGDGLTPEKAQELADGLAQIAQGYQAIAEAQIANLEASRTWEAGWREAFASYSENARNAADQAKSYFETFTKGFEDLIVSLVTNGKFSFKDFANSIIADFARIQARKILTGIMGGGGGTGGGGSILDSLFKFGKGLFGFAAGGSVMGDRPIMVGERGPEMFVPRSAGRIIPNNRLGDTTMQNSTTVNYNIQAVDASSFRTLVARDPQFIYAVTEKGRRSQPTRSRL